LIFAIVCFLTTDLSKKWRQGKCLLCKESIVRPPIGWTYPNSSSAWTNKSWNVGWFKYEAAWLAADAESWRTCLAGTIADKRKPIIWYEWKRTKNLKRFVEQNGYQDVKTCVTCQPKYTCIYRCEGIVLLEVFNANSQWWLDPSVLKCSQEIISSLAITWLSSIQ